MTIVMIFSGAVILMLHRFIEVKNIETLKGITFKNQRTDILKLSMKDSAKMVLSSKYLGFICILMISYSTTVNLIEGLWMSRAKALYPETVDFMNYQGTVLFWTGISTLFFIFIGSSIIRYLGWFWGAVMPPMMIFIAGSVFFTSVVAEEYVSDLIYGLLHISPLMFVVIIGGLQNVIGKGAKYALFDATKELVYIPLDKEMKIKGKAAVDVLGPKIGKSAGAVLQMVTFMMFPSATHEGIAGFLMSIFVVVCLFWIYGVARLNSEYSKKLKSMENVSE